MKTLKRKPLFQKPDSDKLPASSLDKQIKNYIVDGQIQQCSPRTCGNRQDRLRPLVIYVQRNGFPEVGAQELRGFFAHLTSGHDEPEGRFGNPKLKKPVTPGTVRSYYSTLCAFFNWLVEQEELASNPMDRIKPPINRPDQIEPFTEEEVQRMIRIAKQSSNPKRDEAILTVLLDCGLRASELCGLQVTDLNLDGRKLRVEGKGGKCRDVPFHPYTQKVLYNYLREEGHSEDDYLFLSDRGVEAGAALGRVGLGKLTQRLGQRAGVQGANPHRWRHTFAVNYLRSGGNELSLQTIMGHTSLKMTREYVSFAQADITRFHTQCSPAAHILSNKGSKRLRIK